MTRVLVVDDSAFMRRSVSRALMMQPDLEVVGTAADGIEALSLVRLLKPDVVTLDIEMPRMDGLQALAQIMQEMPLPVVMLSSLTTAGAPATIRALELGAVDFVAKSSPTGGPVGMSEEQLAQVVRTAAHARVHPRSPLVAQFAAKARHGTDSASRPARPVPVQPRRNAVLPERVVAIGCSTGGPRALIEVVPHLPANLPAAVLIVQHMPAGFTRSLAERLDQASPLHVKEAEEGDLPTAGSVLIAPGGRHMRLEASGRVTLSDAPPVHGVRPSVDVLFESLPAVFGRRIVAAVLTGMGSDGADGAACLRAAGGQIVVEDQSTAVVYGMPRAVAERGLAHRELPLREIAGALTDLALNERVTAAPAQSAVHAVEGR